MAIPLKYNLRNLLVRKMTTLATAGGIALVVVRKGSTNDGSSSVTREAVQALRYLSGIARTPEGEPLVSPELINQPFIRPKGGGRENVLVRGVTPTGYLLHGNVRFVPGPPPRPAVGEVAVGIAASQRY